MKVYLDYHEQIVLYQRALYISTKLLNAITLGDYDRYVVYLDEYDIALEDIKKIKGYRPLQHHELKNKLNVLRELLTTDRAIANIVYPSLSHYLS
jgi:hypothetical protein